MQLLAMLTMLMDHIGFLFFPQAEVFRWIGRLAMPLYAYSIAVGYQRTSNLKRYTVRLLLICAAAELPFVWVFHTARVNIVGTFIVSLGVLWVVERIRSKGGKIVLVIGATVGMELLPFEYGGYALLLVLIFHFVKDEQKLLAHVLLNVLFFFYKGLLIEMASSGSTILLVRFPQLFVWLERIRVPRWFWRTFYPVHLLILAILQEVVFRSMVH
jgi:hypothetical protein